MAFPLCLADENPCGHTLIGDSGGCLLVAEFHQKQKPFPTDIRDDAGIRLPPSRHIVERELSYFRGMSANIVVYQIFDDRMGHGAGERIATEGAPMVTGLQTAGYFFRHRERAKGGSRRRFLSPL